ncbi:MAG: MFS transporter [Cyanobacteria bacterium P01_D01_bin.56]
MRKFTLIWIGQLVSTVGSYMTSFALTLWVWSLTESTTALALVSFFWLLSRICISLIAGTIVDRINRKYLIILGDAIVASSTLGLLILYSSENLAIWHLYVAAGIKGSFGQIQELAYAASITLLVSPKDYTRASSMGTSIHYGSSIFAPAIAGVLYPVIGLGGILPIDLVTFVVAISTVLWLKIPQAGSESKHSQRDTGTEDTERTEETVKANSLSLTKLTILWDELTFGIKYIWQRDSLRTLMLITALFWFAHDLGGAISNPMILARSNNNSQVLGAISSAAGIGGVTSAVVLTVWGGTKRRINSMLTGFMGAGIAKTVFGLGQSVTVWLPAQFCSSLNFPLLGSAEAALWMDAISPELQGRVFAANSLGLQLVSAIATLIAGPLSDFVLEPAMRSQRLPFAPIFGHGAGAGMALLYVFCAIVMCFTGAVGYRLPQLSRLEDS